MTAPLDAAITAIFGGLLCFCATTLHEISGILKAMRNDARRPTGEPSGSSATDERV